MEENQSDAYLQGRKEDIGSYRAIAETNVAEVFGNVMDNKIMRWEEEQKIVGEEQNYIGQANKILQMYLF